MRGKLVRFGLAVFVAAACSGPKDEPEFGTSSSGGSEIGGAAPTGGKAATGGDSANGGSPATATGGNASPATGGATSTGGATATGGTTGTGGVPSAGNGGAANTDAGAAASDSPPAPGGAAGSDDGGTLTRFRLAVIGSSTSAGEGASSTAKGWVSLLSKSLEASVEGEFTSNNLSVGGYSSDDLMPDGSSGNIDDAIDRDPNLILVALAGSNDLSAGTSKSQFLSRLSAIRERGEEARIPVFILTTAPKDLSNDEQEELQDWADTIQDEFGTCWTPGSPQHSPCVIDVFEPLANSGLGVRSEFSAGDGIHLNDTGHAEIARLTEAIVKPYVCSVAACR
jgi:lysophospholipase L1-like esterase